jgi:2-polyprenyl-6-methoxyphenol hydroxylase-like FAD-dependent oxidoreductase
MNKRVLITGGGIAGMAAAWWLERGGADVTIIERAHEFAPLGHYLTLKSHGVHTIRNMGLLDACRARELTLRELEARAPDGRLLRTLDASLLARNVAGTLLFRRADLHAALYDAVRGRIDLRFGCEVQAMRAVGDQVEVDLPTGSERVDLVLGADGIHSRTRQLVFGGGGLTPMGGRYIAVTVDVQHGLQPGTIRTYFGRGQFVGLLPRTATELLALIYQGDGVGEPAGRDVHALRDFLLRAYSGFAPEVRRSFAALDQHSFVFTDQIAMVTLPEITRGRIALLGDAAHCPTFMSGMGASLALQGAEALQRALAQHANDIPAALGAYAREITPIARDYQSSARSARHFLLDRSPGLAALRDAAIRFTPDWLISSGARRYYRAEQLAAEARLPAGGGRASN